MIFDFEWNKYSKHVHLFNYRLCIYWCPYLENETTEYWCGYNRKRIAKIGRLTFWVRDRKQGL